jgi:hypothetical protein
MVRAPRAAARGSTRSGRHQTPVEDLAQVRADRGSGHIERFRERWYTGCGSKGNGTVIHKPRASPTAASLPAAATPPRLNSAVAPAENAPGEPHPAMRGSTALTSATVPAAGSDGYLTASPSRASTTSRCIIRHTSPSVRPATHRSRSASGGPVGLPCAWAKSQCPSHTGDHRATRNSETACSPTTSTAATKAVCEYILSTKATRAGAGRGKAEDTGGPRVAGVPAKRKAAAGAAQRAPAPKRTRTAAPANTATATPLSEEAHRRQLMREGKQRAPRQEEKPPIIFF